MSGELWAVINPEFNMGDVRGLRAPEDNVQSISGDKTGSEVEIGYDGAIAEMRTDARGC
jgi:hypothetical protein